MSFLCVLGIHKWFDSVQFVRNERGRFARQRCKQCAKCGRTQ